MCLKDLNELGEIMTWLNQNIFNVLQLFLSLAGVCIAYLTYKSATKISAQITKAKAETASNAQFANTYQDTVNAIDEALDLLKKTDPITMFILIDVNKIANRLDMMSKTWDEGEQTIIREFAENSNTWTLNTDSLKQDYSIKGSCIVHLNKVKSILEHRRFM